MGSYTKTLRENMIIWELDNLGYNIETGELAVKQLDNEAIKDDE